MAGKRCTAVEHEIRVQKVVQMLAEGEARAAIVLWMREKYKLCAHQVDNYIARAKARKSDEFTKARLLHREDQYWALRVISENKGNSVNARVRARELMGKLLSLDDTKVATNASPILSGDYGNDANYESALEDATDQELMVLYELHQRAKQKAIAYEEQAIIDAVAVNPSQAES